MTEPTCQLLSVESECSEDCSASQWEVSAKVTDGADGTGIEHVSIRKGLGTISTSRDPDDESIMLVSYTASCCSPLVELVAVDRVGNVGSCVYTVFEPSENAFFSKVAPIVYVFMGALGIGTFLLTGLTNQ